MGESIVITSGKGGVGKTTTTANLGACLAQLGRSVVLIDADIGLRNLDVILGLESRIIFDLVDVVDGFCDFSQALIRDPRFEALYLLPAAQTRDKSAVNPHQMRRLTLQAKREFDYVLVDCPAGIEQGFHNAVAGADVALVVTTPDVTAVRDADRVLGLLDGLGLSRVGLILNRYRPELVDRGVVMGMDEVVDLLAANLTAVVPEEEEIMAAANRGQPVNLSAASRAADAYRNLARRLTGEDVPLMELDRRAPGVLERLLRIWDPNR